MSTPQPDQPKADTPENDINSEQIQELSNKLPTIPEAYDSGWKRIVFCYLFQVIQYFYPNLYDHIDTTRDPEFLDKELKQIRPRTKVGNKAADMLVKLHRNSEQKQVLLCHFEFQTKVDYSLGERAFIYSYRIFDKLKIYPITILFLTDAQGSFRPEPLYLRPIGDTGIKFTCWIVKTLDYLPRLEQLKHAQDVISQVLSIYLECQQEKKKLKNYGRKRSKTAARPSHAQLLFDVKIKIMKRLVPLDLDETQVSELLLFLDWLISLPEHLEAQYIQIQSLEFDRKEGVMAFVSSFERVGMAKGRLEGRVEGKVEGRAEGRSSTLQEVIVRSLEKRYDLSNQEKAIIHQCNDLSVLTQAVDACIDQKDKNFIISYLNQ